MTPQERDEVFGKLALKSIQKAVVNFEGGGDQLVITSFHVQFSNGKSAPVSLITCSDDYHDLAGLLLTPAKETVEQCYRDGSVDGSCTWDADDKVVEVVGDQTIIKHFSLEADFRDDT